MDNDCARILGQAVLDRKNILIAGATGSGKTTIAKALIEAIPLEERLVTIEDTAEWNSIPAVKNNRVYALEANSYWSRPGPRLLTGIAAMAKIFHPGVEIQMLTEGAVLPIEPLRQAVTA